MDAKRLSHELRRASGRHLRNRRRIVLSSLSALGCMALISLYQMGIVRHLPELPLKWLNADRVDASEEAYAHLRMGDAYLGMASYAVTAGLAAMGGKERAANAPVIPLALAAKAGVDLAQAARLTYDQYAKHRAACMWCLLAAGATLATAVLALPEAKEAARTVASRRARVKP